MQHYQYHPRSVVTLVFAMLALASPDNTEERYLETLPPPDASPYYCIIQSGASYASARVMVGEVLESRGRCAESIQWAQAELEVRE